MWIFLDFQLLIIESLGCLFRGLLYTIYFEGMKHMLRVLYFAC
jgi:hypothetical protein